MNFGNNNINSEAFVNQLEFGIPAMCVGNLRSATQYLGNFLESRQRQDLERCLLYFGVIFWFVLGAVLCYFLIPMFGQLTLLVPVAFLAAAFLIMFVDREKSESLSA